MRRPGRPGASIFIVAALLAATLQPWRRQDFLEHAALLLMLSFAFVQ